MTSDFRARFEQAVKAFGLAAEEYGALQTRSKPGRLTEARDAMIRSRSSLLALVEEAVKDTERWRHIDENSTDSIGLRGYAINVWRESPSETLASIVDECIMLDTARTQREEGEP